MPEILDLYDYENEDPELVPVILPLDARLSLRGPTEEFRALFERLTAITPQKELIPGTSFVHVLAENDVVRFTATDNEQTLVLETSTIKINRDGRALLPGHKLKQIFGLAPDDNIILTVLANDATVSSGRAIWTVNTPPGEKQPPVPGLADIEFHSVPRRPLLAALQATRRALPSLGSRKSLEQAHFSNGAVTTSDGYRLFRQTIEGFPAGLTMSLPKKGIEELMRALLAFGEENIDLGASDSHIAIRFDKDTLITSQLALDFPEVERVLIKPALENEGRLTLNVLELRDIIKRVRVSADPEYSTVSLLFAIKDGEWQLTVSTRDRSGNSASEGTVVVWEGDPEPFQLVVNHTYLTDLLESYKGRLIELRVGKNSKTKPAALLVKDDAKGFTAVVSQSLSR